MSSYFFEGEIFDNPPGSDLGCNMWPTAMWPSGMWPLLMWSICSYIILPINGVIINTCGDLISERVLPGLDLVSIGTLANIVLTYYFDASADILSNSSYSTNVYQDLSQITQITESYSYESNVVSVSSIETSINSSTDYTVDVLSSVSTADAVLSVVSYPTNLINVYDMMGNIADRAEAYPTCP